MGLYSIITPGDLRALSKGTFNEDYDPLIDDLIIKSIDKNFPAYCHRDDFDLKTRTEFHSPQKDDKYIFLNAPPVSLPDVETPEPVELWQDTAHPPAYASDTKLVVDRDYVVFENSGVIEKIGAFAGGPKSVKVTYKGGYLTADGIGAPEDLKMAAMIAAKILFDKREELSLQSRALEGGSFTLFQPLILSPSVTRYLDFYRFRYSG